MLKVAIQSFTYSQAVKEQFTSQATTEGREILNDVFFSLAQGEHLAILGASGSGKSTLLHLIYGLLPLEHGSIYWGKKKLMGPAHHLVPGEPFMKLLSQELDLMPFISVAENIASHLDKLQEEKDALRIDQLLEVVGLRPFKNKKVKYLSGGQKQRVGLAKALANKPKLLLLDEPFSSIDSFLKNKLRRTLFNYLKENNISCITATHDAEEALAFSDRLLILREGSVDALDTPKNVYNNVASKHQASFFGEVTVLPESVFTGGGPDAFSASKERFFWPHQLRFSEERTNVKVTIVHSYFKGSHYLIEASWEQVPVFFTHSTPIEKGKSVFIALS